MTSFLIGASNISQYISFVLRTIFIQSQSNLNTISTLRVGAILLANKGRTMIAGECVEYIFINSLHANPLYRVAPRALIEENEVDYDKEKYRDMLLEAAETVLSIFGFDRTVYGDATKKYKKWWQRLNEERTRDRDAETI